MDNQVEKLEKFKNLFARMLIAQAGEILAGTATVRSVTERLKMYGENAPTMSVKQSITIFKVPDSSPVNDALAITPARVTIDRKLFQTNASIAIREFEKQCDLIASLIQYHPTVEQRDYVSSHMFHVVDSVKKRFDEMEADQIRFEMPKQ